MGYVVWLAPTAVARTSRPRKRQFLEGYIMTHLKIPKDGTCSLSGGRYDDLGHNPTPLGRVPERCCTECNSTLVIPARLRRLARERARREDVR
jgi:hypothetical protein